MTEDITFGAYMLLPLIAGLMIGLLISSRVDIIKGVQVIGPEIILPSSWYEYRRMVQQFGYDMIITNVERYPGGIGISLRSGAEGLDVLTMAEELSAIKSQTNEMIQAEMLNELYGKCVQIVDAEKQPSYMKEHIGCSLN